jgi:anti-sigma regulatory factor (Ser/Thr protein kinase)
MELHATFGRFFDAAERAGAIVPPGDRAAIITATAEIAANIVAHACRHLPDAQVSLLLTRRRDRVEANLEDPGVPFVEPGRPAQKDEGVPHLGIGLGVARSSVDSLDYERKRARNHWHLVRVTESP